MGINSTEKLWNTEQVGRINWPKQKNVLAKGREDEGGFSSDMTCFAAFLSCVAFLGTILSWRRKKATRCIK